MDNDVLVILNDILVLVLGEEGFWDICIVQVIMEVDCMGEVVDLQDGVGVVVMCEMGKGGD